MTIGEKIANLRSAAHISQEQLAEELSVSRQSVSKWEVNQSLPQIENILTLCRLFRVTADALLRDDISLFGDVPGQKSAINETGAKNKYFGTDGFRGEANVTLTADHAYRVGRFLGWYYASPLSGFHMPNYRPRILIGKDTRRSSYMLEYAIAAGLTASGADAYMLHVTTTPSVSYVTRTDEFDCGIMITASHNPFYDNGIKLINRYGEKMDDATTALVEAYLDGDVQRLGLDGNELPLARREAVGSIVDYVAGRNRYVGYLISLASHSYREMKIGLDCANGASWMIAKAVFEALGARTYVMGTAPNGLNVNDGCGSTHIDALRKFVLENHLDVGFAFDGDADRCIAVDERGELVTGDHILYIFGKSLASRGMLTGNTVVTTVMSNLALYRALDEAGIRTEKTDVGDRFVWECMAKNGYEVGGEQSGHIILKKYATTGDGVLTAIKLTEEMLESKTTLSYLASPVVFCPQVLKNLRVPDKKRVTGNPEVRELVKKINDRLGNDGRILLRESGTEPVVRVMAEAGDSGTCEKLTDEVIACIRRLGLDKDANEVGRE